MLRPSATQLLKNNESKYSLVIAVAKRAREITENAIEDKVVLNERPVKIAVDQLAAGEYRFIEDPRVSK
ncbi:MAG: DNA-directed RNA polymerase subunit omega [Oscillospiraceae bacterium]